MSLLLRSEKGMLRHSFVARDIALFVWILKSLVLSERARLLGRIVEWTDPLAWEFVSACARRVAGRAATALRAEGRRVEAAALEKASDLDELERAATNAADHPGPSARLAGYVADVCFYARDAGIAARAGCVAAKMSAHALASDVDDERGYADRLANERAWQAAWLADRIGLGVPEGIPGLPARS
jgi:hypothetical protein